jgi:O-acetylserine/cysteine efflux transporter
MVVIWGANYSVIKRAFLEIPPQPFNAIRMALAACVFLITIRLAQRRARATRGRMSPIFYTPFPLTRRDRIDLFWLGLVGHWMYQLFFVGGVAKTSVSNGALIIGATPVAIATVSALLGREAIGCATLGGDLLVMISVACWTTYTLGAAHLIKRHSPLYVTGMTMAIGAVPYALLALPQIIAMNWAAVSAWTWTALVLSALLALCLSYLIWYIAVQRIGPARTSLYSNLVPIVAISVAAIWLGEPLTPPKLTGAGLVLAGVFLSRLGRKMTAPEPGPEQSGG